MSLLKSIYSGVQNEATLCLYRAYSPASRDGIGKSVYFVEDEEGEDDILIILVESS